MSQKAIKKRTIETFKQALHIPVKPLPRENQRQAKPLPAKSFPLNKFIALPDGLKVKSKSDDLDQTRRTIPIKAVAISPSSSLSSKAHIYAVGPEGDDLTSTHNVGVSENRDTTKVTENSAPLSTSTPRSERRPRARRGYHSESNSRPVRPVTPSSSITSADSEGSSRRGLYKKRSQSTPADVGRQRLPSEFSDVLFSKWSDNDLLPGLNRTTSYQTVHDGVTIESDNWTIANVTSVDGRIQTVYRTNIGHSRDTSHDNSFVSSTRSSSPLEFTDVCNLNVDTVTPNDSYKQNLDSVDFARSVSHSSENTGVLINSDWNSFNESSHGFIHGPHYATLPRNYKVVRSYSDMNIDKSGKINMDKMNSPQSSLHNKTFEVNGIPQTGLLIYRPGKSGEKIIVNDQHPGMPNAGYEFYTVGRKEGSLVKSKLKFSSMPTLFDSKGDKKLIKLLKRQEKEEKKRREKEEKKRAKEEKKRIKLEKKLKTKTLPRNFAYAHTNGHVLSPIENVYRRPKLSLSAVPIDFEDGPAKPSHGKMAPPPPPEPSMRTKSMYASAPDLLRLEQVYGATIRGVPKDMGQPIRYSEYAPRTVVLQKASEGYGFVLRGAKSQLKPNGELDFRPTAEFPALQYLDSIDPGSAADKAGLRPGDFILEINGENVVRASHDRVVHLIRGTGDTLAMKVVTVRAGSRSHDWFNQKEYSSTMPNRKKKAPQPPQRDPLTHLSVSRSEGRSVSEELAIMEKLDQAILEKKTSGEERKTASIRSKLAAKRVSSVDLENIGVNPNQHSKTGPNGNLERSKSTPDLGDDISKTQHIYAVPGINQATTASVIVNDPNSVAVRPKGPPPQPPGSNNSPRKQAPKPPPQDVPPKSEVVNIDTSKSSPYASSKVAVRKEEIKSESQYESSFRPGVSAKLSEEPVASEQTKLKSNLVHDTNAGGSVKSNTTVIHTGDELDKPSVSFAEDKVFDSAATFLKKHPNAKLLVTAEVHNKIKNRNSSVYEPEPDYDQEDSGEEISKEPSSPVRRQDNRQSVTVISIGDKEKEKESNARKRYTIHSSIPSEGIQPTSSVVIPPRPEGPAPVPPTNKSSQSPAKESKKDQSSRISDIKTTAPPPPKEQSLSLKDTAPPPLPETPPPDMDDIPPVPTVVPAPPPLAPPPPPPPPPPPAELSKLPSNVKADYIPPIPKDDIAEAVLKRQKRLEVEGPRVTPQKPKTFQDHKESNQAAILAAVANRRKILEEAGENAVIESIESRLQRTKKLQAAKFNFAGSKTATKKDNEKDEPKSSGANTKANPSTLEKTNIKKEESVPKTNGKPAKEVTNAKPHEISFRVKPATSPTAKSPGVTEIKPKFNVKTAPKTPTETNKTEILKVEVKKFGTSVQKPVSNKVETETKDAKTLNETKVNGESDFLALAEKKRQELLQRKSQKSPSESKTSSARSSVSSSPEKEKFRIKKNSPPTQPKPKSKFPVKGVTTDQSDTENQTKSFIKIKPVTDMNGDSYTNNNSNNAITAVPPPPEEFRDGGNENRVVQLEIIPPPATFSSDSGTEMSHQHSPAFSPDTASLVSSLSTLSSLSGDQNEFRSANSGYEDLIAPPPPGFGDDDTSVIPPPPEFGTEKEKAFSRKSVETWLCNDVLDWLDTIKMSQYKKSFQSNCIDGKKLLELTRNDYLKLEVTQVSHRMNIERSIKKAAFKQNVGASEIIASERL